MEGADGLVLLDIRAASERIIFETMRREAAAGGTHSQRLLLPIVVEMTPKDAVWISENLDALSRAGFLLEPFGGGSFKIEAMPACVGDRDPRETLADVCETLKATGLLGGGQPVLDALIRWTRSPTRNRGRGGSSVNCSVASSPTRVRRGGRP
jgi:DNA mismatch repair ATPase MutL